MKNIMLFFMLLTSVLFVYELNLVLHEKGNWFFVWINVFIFFLEILGLTGAHNQEKRLIRNAQLQKFKPFSPPWITKSYNEKRYVWSVEKP